MVKEFLYEASHFVFGISYSWYFHRLCKELSIIAARWSRKRKTFDSPNPQVNAMVEGLKPRNRSSTYMHEEHSHDEFSVEGFRHWHHWQELDRYEQLAGESGQFYHDLWTETIGWVAFRCN